MKSMQATLNTRKRHQACVVRDEMERAFSRSQRYFEFEPNVMRR